jgi:hypothetical protein
MLAVCYFGISLFIFIPILVIALVAHVPPERRTGFMALGTGFLVLFPFLYGAAGFFAGVVSAWIYNLVAKWIGGIEVEVE